MARKRKRKAADVTGELLGAGLLILLGSGYTFRNQLSSILWGITALALVGSAVAGTVVYLRRKPVPAPPTRSDTPIDWGMEPVADPAAARAGSELHVAWKETLIRDTPSLRPDISRWSLELLDALEWHRLELVTAAYFQCLGFKANTTKFGADGGVDIELYWDGADKPSIIVQCKAWKSKVGISLIRELFGVMTLTGVKEGIFVTTGKYTDDVKAFRAPEGLVVHLIDGHDMLAKIQALPSDQQATLLELATAGDFSTPTCASCGVKMVRREPKKGGASFWGCVNYPKCRTSLHL